LLIEYYQKEAFKVKDKIMSRREITTVSGKQELFCSLPVDIALVEAGGTY
jgi:hypothetical protein